MAEMALPEVAFLRQHQVVSLPSEPKDESGRSFERPKESLYKVVLALNTISYLISQEVTLQYRVRASFRETYTHRCMHQYYKMDCLSIILNLGPYLFSGRILVHQPMLSLSCYVARKTENVL